MLAFIIKTWRIDGADDVPYNTNVRLRNAAVHSASLLVGIRCVRLFGRSSGQRGGDSRTSGYRLISHAAFVVRRCTAIGSSGIWLRYAASGTSLVWHSSGKFQEVDSVFTSIACCTRTRRGAASLRRGGSRGALQRAERKRRQFHAVRASDRAADSVQDVALVAHLPETAELTPFLGGGRVRVGSGVLQLRQLARDVACWRRLRSR